MRNGTVHLILSDDGLTIAPSNDVVEKYLTIEEKSLEPVPGQPWITNSVRKKKKVFRVLKEDPIRAIRTMQGFWLGLRDHLLSQGFQVKVDDLRNKFPAPRLDLISGCRFSQEELLTTALLKDMSGLIGAPTRYGKTTLIVNTLKVYTGLTSVVTAPGVDLVGQLYDDIRTKLPHREVKLIGGSSRVKFPSEDITVMSMDSIDKADYGRTRLLLIDEPHAAVTDSRLPALNAFTKARRLGYGATLTGRYDGRDALITGLIGPVLAERTYKEAVEEGAICPLVVLVLQLPLHPRHVKTSWDRNRAYRNLLFESDRVATEVARICHEAFPDDWQAIAFIRNEKQADFYLERIGQEGTIAMAKKLTSKQRQELMERMAGGEVKRCLASDIYAQGVTFSHVRAIVNIAGGGNNTTTIQKPGRLAEIRPGKKAGIIVDVMFRPEGGLNMQNCGPGVRMILADCRARLAAYEKKGYDIKIVGSVEELGNEVSKYI